MVRLASLSEGERQHLLDLDCHPFGGEPWTAPPPAGARRVAIVSSAGLIVRGERPVPPNDRRYRAIPDATSDADILMSHVSVNFDRTGYQQALSTVFPRTQLHALRAEGLLGSVADTHYSFMGATAPDAMEQAARELAPRLRADGVNTVLLAPV